MLGQHLSAFGTAPNGRLFRGARGGMLSESVYGRAWHAARQAALRPGLAATALARRPCDLRHAALSLWLNASGDPAPVAARAGNSAHVLHEVYLHRISGQDDAVSQRIETALNPGASVPQPPRCRKASGYTHRRHPPDPPRPCPLFVRGFPGNGPRRANGYRVRQARNTIGKSSSVPAFPQVGRHMMRSPPRPGGNRIRPAHSPRDTTDGPRNRSLCAEKLVTQDHATSPDLWNCGRCWVRTNVG
jgi:hypothetical protein